MRFIGSRGGAAVLALVVVGLVTTLSAQGSNDNNGNPVILQAVQAVQSTVDSLATTVGSLVTAVSSLTTTVNNINTATSPGNTLFTPALVGFPPDTLICTVTNVSSAPRNVTTQLINGNTTALVSQTTTTLNPGFSTSALGTPPSAGLRAFCKVTVNNGVKTDVRGVLAMFGAATASDKDPIAAE